MPWTEAQLVETFETFRGLKNGAWDVTEFCKFQNSAAQELIELHGWRAFSGSGMLAFVGHLTDYVLVPPDRTKAPLRYSDPPRTS